MSSFPPPNYVTVPSSSSTSTWQHIAVFVVALIFIAIGFVDACFLHKQLTLAADLTFISAGGAALGLKSSGAIG